MTFFEHPLARTLERHFAFEVGQHRRAQLDDGVPLGEVGQLGRLREAGKKPKRLALVSGLIPAITHDSE